MAYSKENLFLLRLPKDHADRVREAIRTDALRDRLQIEFFSGQRYVKVKFDEDNLSGKLLDLPSIIEVHKTLDKRTIYKTGDISQMVECTKEHIEMPEERLDELPLSRRKEMAKKFTSNHGIAPPLKNIRKRRFRKTAPKKFIDSPEIEKELKRLLREDLQAVNVSYKVINEENRQDDNQSVISGNTSSRAHTPAFPPDEESMTSSSLNEDVAKSELMKMFKEVTSSSEDEEEEEITVEVTDDEGSPSNPEIVQLHQAIVDLDLQIEEQKMKIETTANSVLRARFETFLSELERQRQEKSEELQNISS
ncbi:PREDICTED: transcription initiation factor TFIID subunit 7-like [Amphimedon queenslandica]|uniref:TAFII55 protein conserved region domain-containing protein n=1 Tax=Amphimedon queenslandica TaxID=400682 RepID=A0A1X7V175_AMPQE|nr:PREDICTED: transcription initiation factor TFIID subunit 7-like [Amphimedon queenslandica]|eukprot:XP_019851137.1 PREDICTED: transcription initiation factor TFIID subunit 7-like [Amphimedon queenslandica]